MHLRSYEMMSRKVGLMYGHILFEISMSLSISMNSISIKHSKIELLKNYYYYYERWG